MSSGVLVIDQAWPLLLNTAVLVAATWTISLPLGSLLGWLLLRTDLPGRRAAIILLGVLLFVPLYLQAAAWQAGFGLQGWAILVFGMPVWLESWTGSIWVHAMAALPWVTLIAGAGFRLVEPELEEQAILDATPRQVFFHVTARSALPAITIAAVWVMILTAGEMTVTDLFGVRTYAEEVYTRMAMGEGPRQSLVSVLPGMLLLAVLVGAAIVAVARIAPRDRPIPMRARWVYRLGRWRVFAVLLTAIVLVILVGIPLGNLLYKAGAVVRMSDDEMVRSWSGWKLVTMVVTSPLRNAREFAWSLALSGSAATAAVAAAIGAAWWSRRGEAATATTVGLAAVALAVPGPLVGLATIALVNRPEVPLLAYLYDRSILAPWLALVIRCFPPAVLILWQAMRTIPREMLDAAAVDGASPAGQLWRIVLPSRLHALGLAWLIAWAVALGDLAASILVVPPGVTTLSIRIFGLLHYGVEDQVAGICLAMTAIFAGIAALAIFLAGRWRKAA
ncbi:MAG: iron ABC transporter permease [Rhodopirellula sp.]|nr:iron ABC transporter permease [Rhodopirellula sp.]